MARSICYQLVHVQTGTAAGSATAQVLKNCRAYGVQFTTTGSGGASSGRLSQTVEINNSAQANGDTNNAQRETILAGHVTTFVGTSTVSGMCGGVSPIIPVSVPLKVGDVLSANQVQTGTAPTSANTVIRVYCIE